MKNNKISNINLRVKILIYFIMLGIIFLSSFLFLRVFNHQSQNTTAYQAILNTSGRRVYTISAYLNWINQGYFQYQDDLKENLRLFETQLRVLKKGGTYTFGESSILLDGINSKHRAKVQQIEKVWEEYKEQLNYLSEFAPSTVVTAAVSEPSVEELPTPGFDFSFGAPSSSGSSSSLDYNTRNDFSTTSLSEELLKAREDFAAKTEELFLHCNELQLDVEQDLGTNQIRTLLGFSLFLIISLIALVSGYVFIINSTIVPLKQVMRVAKVIAAGEFGKKIHYRRFDEVGALIQSINVLIESLQDITYFAQNIGTGNFDFPFSPRSDHDTLGNSLIDMRNNLKNVALEDDRRNWANKGLATFSEILRNNNDDLNKLSYEIISNLVQYLGANQGGIFLLSTDKQELTMSSAYAYSKQKYLQKQISSKRGLLGKCVQEKEIIHLTEIPEGYIEITSGLGEATPNALLLVPLKISKEVFGVIEMASFSEFAPYQIEFIDKLSENIASTLSTVQANQQNRKLLEETQLFTETLQAQEEEMRQNMEELQATQEEMERIQKEYLEKDHYLETVILDAFDYIITTDEELHISFFSKSSEDFFAQLGILVRHDVYILDILPENIKDLWQQKLQVALNNRSARTFNTIAMPLTGERIIEFIFTPILHKDGHISGISVIGRDMTALTPIRWEEYETV